MTIYVPVAALTSLVMLGAIYWFVSFEKTAITTVPPAETVQAFVPQTPTPQPPTEVPQPTATGQAAAAEPTGVAWTNGVADLMKTRCVACHGTTGGFNAETYADTMKAVTPGDPDGSKLVQVQSRGKHPGQFKPDEMNLIREWISAGAPEQPTTGGAPAAASSDTWATLNDTFQKKCGACHGTSGGYSVKTYADAVKQITPGNPDTSKVVEVQRSGKHPGKFTDEELMKVILWIQSGAPEK
jgi:mono/diheme cytochrome c family protein